MLTFLLHNIGLWPFYYTIFGFYQCTTHLTWTCLLHNIWYWPFYYTTLGFDLFTTQHSVLTFVPHNSGFWPLCDTTFDFDIFTTQPLILTFLLRNIRFWPVDYTTLGLTVLLHQTRFWSVAGMTVCEVHVPEVEYTENLNLVGAMTTWYQRVYQETSVWWDSVQQNQIFLYGVQKYPKSKIESKVT